MTVKTYLVGGAVRDILLGLEPKDRDYVIVGASYSDIQQMVASGFKQVGADFPVFLHPTTGAEYALARVERKTGDGYLGFSVETEGVTLEEDLSRRDFTMNAMAMDEDGVLTDPYGGQEDLRAGRIRHTSDAFSEDPLRVLRAARFSARYDFKLDPSTFNLCERMCRDGELRHLSNERIWLELEKGLGEKPSAFMQVLAYMGALQSHPVLETLFPYEVGGFDMAELEAVSASAPNRWKIALALTADTNNVPGIDNQTKQLIKLAQELRCFTEHGWNGERLLALVSAAGGLTGSPVFEDLKEIARTLRMASHGKSVPDEFHLNVAAKLAAQVRADQFQIPPGPELGAAIKHGRIKAIAEALGIPE